MTSRIFLDQITTAGTGVNSRPVPASMVVTTFPSKSELALNLSKEGGVVTFMGYVAPVNPLDISIPIRRALWILPIRGRGQLLSR